MKITQLLPWAGICTAFVLPDQEIFSSLSLEDKNHFGSSRGTLQHFNDVLEGNEQFWANAFASGQNTWESARRHAGHLTHSIKDLFQQYESAGYEIDVFDTLPRDQPPHHGPHLLRPPQPSHKPHHPPHHEKPNRTVYELISESKYTTKLAKLIDEDEELVQLLNSTAAKFTVFAPVDSAFAKIPKDHKKPSKEFIKKLLTYHVATDFYPAGRVLLSHTIPTALEAEYLGDEPQRLSTQISLRGLTINYSARVVGANLFGTNGVIHAIDSILIPPPTAMDIISYLPGQFSTLELGLIKTGLYDELNNTSAHVGGTLFAPSNFAFERLGPRVTGFLFSKWGEKYLKALLEYHVVANYTLYSDAFYKGCSDESETGNCSHLANIPKGVFHVDLPTLLCDRSLSIDIARYGRFVTMKINGFTRVTLLDGIAADGVIHVVPNVLIPPKTPGGLGETADGMELEELRERLQPFVVDSDGESSAEL